MLLAIILFVLLALWSCRIAVRRGYNVSVGMFPGLLMPKFGWLLVSLLPPTAEGIRQAKFEEQINRELAQERHMIPLPGLWATQFGFHSRLPSLRTTFDSR